MKFAPSLLCLFCSLVVSGFGQGSIGGTLTADTVLDLQGSPWAVTSEVTVPQGVTLRVEAGVRVEFDEGARFLVDEGRLVVDGTESAPVVLGRAPDASHAWDGLVFRDTMEDNRLTHFSMEYGDDAGESIDVTRSRVTIQFGQWPTTEDTMIEMDEPAVIIEDSQIPGISGGEVIHGEDLVSPGYLILRRNTFGVASNGGDVLDFTRAEAPGPILQIIDNVFMGGDDDGLDLDGTDAFISGNVFMNFRKDPANSRATTSNAVATGLPQSGAPNRTRIRVVRNLFLNCDHAVLLKEEAFMIAENNTFVGMHEAVIQFDEEGGTAVQGPGKGAVLSGNVFWDYSQMFKFLIPDTELTVDHCLIDPQFHDRGIGNLQGDPGFEIVDHQYALRTGSPAIGTGPNGLDMGYLVPGGASISGEPLQSTWRSDASLTVGGPAIVQYRFRLNGGEWSGDTPVATPISLSGLSGENTVEVIGQDSEGIWQAEESPTVSQTWTVDPASGELFLNEIVAHTGQVELWNHSGSPIELGGYRLNGIELGGHGAISPDGYLVVDAPSLDPAGGRVELRDATGGLVDGVDYGIQISGHSIGRTGRDQVWALNVPTPGADNVRRATAIRDHLKLNEWLLNADCLFTDEFVELFNPEGLPVSLAGLEVDIEPMSFGRSWVAPGLSFIAAGGFTAVFSDGQQADFEPTGEVGSEISLWEGGVRLDQVINQSGIDDVSGGRVPAGGDDLETFVLPTPGFAVKINEIETVTALIAIDAQWGYEDSDTDLGTAWRDPGYDDASWASGAGLLGRETSEDELPVSLETEINYEESTPTYYFRHRFQFAGDAQNAQLRLRPVVDDGAVFYLNGVELHRLRMEDPVSHGSFASDNVGNADFEGPFDLPADGLLQGENVLAVEVHQDDDSSSDIVFGLELEVVETEFVSDGLGDAEAIMAGLRLTEIMFQPAGDPDAEFLELRNVGPESFDLGGLRFVEGVHFEFLPMMLAPGEFVYVVKDQAAFGHPELRVAGEYAGELSDTGGRIRLELPFGAGVVDETYLANAVDATAGGGNSLELAFDGGLKGGAWVASPVTGGTHGALSEFQAYADWAGDVFSPAELEDMLVSGSGADPDQDGVVNLLEQLFGLNPKQPDAAGLPDLQVEGDDVVIRFSRSIRASGQLSLERSGDLIAWSAEIPGLVGRVNSANGDRQEVELRLPVGTVVDRYFRLEGRPW